MYLNPVNDSTVVYFSCDEGSMVSHIKRTRDHEGVAYSEWISGNNVDTADGLVVIMAETSGGTVADTSFFYNTSPTWTIEVNPAFPTSVNASDESKFVITIHGSDFNGLYPIDGIGRNDRSEFPQNGIKRLK